jgi:AbrB family looped-hinge helix DNA binding protein
MDISNKQKLIVLTHKYGSENDLYIEIPQTIREDLDWKEGDTLIWEIKGDNSIVIRKELSVSEYKEQAIKEHLEDQDFDSYYDWIYQICFES